MATQYDTVGGGSCAVAIEFFEFRGSSQGRTFWGCKSGTPTEVSPSPIAE
eukprot:CAMPEP_0170639380 /NCGR_PEP_ID=MMETSP0224-20130122/39618_1 /TAXON_ID=285029 /ORGANISM="Togula jolla, Strain CCCM 725" /LENGTH=49 /DNA_ID=CAMNT_0010969731 /DNA_START=144 /DNA_END=293 /DNA_ORIENTATION=+